MYLLPFRRLCMPLLLLIAGLIFRDNILELSANYQVLLSSLPYVTLGAATALCLYYKLSRLCALTLLLLLTYWLIQTSLQVALLEPDAFLVYSLLSLVLPFNLTLLLVLPEKGLYNRYGLLMIAFIPIQLLLGWWLINLPEVLIITQQLMPIKPFQAYVLSVLASSFFLLSALLISFSLYKQDNEYKSVLLVVLLFSFIILALFDRPKISVILFAIAGISLIMSLIRHIYDMAYYDELTGLRGRRALNEKLKGLGKKYVIAMLDVDHFKKFNDTYGHDVGDDVLKMVAAQIAAVTNGGVAYRYGGEEFCIVFSNKHLEQCLPALESVRQAVAVYSLSLRNNDHRSAPKEQLKARRGRRKASRADTVSVTISIGAAERDKVSCSQADEVLKAADTALYKAKKKGRNCLAY